MERQATNGYPVRLEVLLMKTCLMLLDLQHGILQSDRIPWESKDTPGKTIAAAQQLRSAARGAGVLDVGAVRPIHEGEFDRPRMQAALKSGKVPRKVLPMAVGSPDAPIEGEEVVHKMGVSAFCGTRVEGRLRNRGAQEVVVAGAFTHMVVERAVGQGFDLGFELHVAAGTCCSPTTALHEASLANGISNFARILGDIEAASAVLEAGRKVR
jgi:nicotinamidase-related amidase